ncbi:MAG: chaperone protein DnaJ [Pseudomonadota bacterium]
MRDPYSVLGVKQTAAAEEIKAAWRSLAKAVHPDTNRDDPQAHIRFAEVGRAYDILRDPERRTRYDLERQLRDAKRARKAQETNTQSAGKAGMNGDKTADPVSGTETSDDILSKIFGTAGARTSKQAFSGQTAAAPDPVADLNPLLSAAEIFSGLLRKLTGHSDLPDKAPDLLVDLPVTIDDLFKQARISVSLPDGKSLKVALPQGAVDGQMIHLPEAGYRFPGMARGDVVATVRMQKHPLFQTDGHDVRTVVPVDIENAVLGCETLVDTPQGQIRIDVPAWSGSDCVLVVEGHGLPKADGTRGNLLVELRLMLWDHPDAKVTDLMRSLREGLYL